MPKAKKNQQSKTIIKSKTNDKNKNNWFTKNQYILLIAALVFIVLSIYSNSINNGFVLLDDTAKIQENQLITGLNWGNLSSMFSKFVFHTYFPLTLFSYAIDYFLWGGLKPEGFHFTNLILHTINVVLLYVFAKQFSGNRIAAFIASVIFAAHPMNVETVAWLSERSNLMYTMFFLASMISYIKIKDAGNKTKYLLFTYLFFLLSLLSKSSAVILPLVFILIDFFRQGRFIRRNILSKMPYLAISLLFGIIAIYASTSTDNMKDISASYNIFDRIFLAIYPLVFYFVKFFAPFNLSALHPYPIKSSGFLPISYYLSVIPFLLFIIISLKVGRLKKIIVFAFLFFLFNILILLMIVPIGGNFLMAEHFVYVPFIGFALASGIIFSNIREKIIRTKIPAAAILTIYYIMIPLFCITTYSRNDVWKNSTALFTDINRKNPDNAFAHYGMGTIYIDEKKYFEALSELNHSITLDSNFAEAYYNRSIAYLQLMQVDSAMADVNRAIQLKPEYHTAYIERGNLKAMTGDTLGAISDFDKAIDIFSNNSVPFYNRGRLKMNLKKYTEAIADFDEAIRLNPEYLDALNNRGIAKYFSKDYSGSVNDYNEVLKIDDTYVNAYKNRGLSKLASADSAGACEDFYAAFNRGLKDVVGLIKKNCK